MRIGNTAKKADIFGTSRGFSIAGQNKYKTKVGFFCTVFYVIALLYSVFLYLVKFGDRDEHPEVKSKIKFLRNSPRLNFKKLNFIFSITGFIDGNAVKPKELLQTVKVTIQVGERYLNQQNKISEQVRSFGARPCIEEDFVVNGYNLLESAQFSDITQSVCSKNGEIIVDGEGLQAEKRFVRIIIEPC
jgi:hypothetical protein